MGVKISDLPTATQPFSGPDEIPLVQNTETRKATLNSLVSYLSSGYYDSDYTLTNAICARSTKERFEQNEYVDIKDFGAKGDGITDDWLAIQRAIYAASAVPFGTSGWPAPSAVLESDVFTYTLAGYSISRPRIWGSQGKKTVYIPEGDFLISKPLIITSGTTIEGSSTLASTLLLSSGSMCNFIESMNLALTRLYPEKFEIFDEWNAQAGIKNLSLRRSLIGVPLPPYSNPTKKDWIPITSSVLLSGLAGNSVLSAAPYVGYNLIPTTDYQIKLLHEYGTVNETAYNITKITTREVTISPPLATNTPLTGTRFLVGFPSQNGIFTSGGENYCIDNVQINIGQTGDLNTLSARASNQGAGIFVYRGSPAPTIKDCMCNNAEVGYWIEEGPALLLKPSGDGNKIFVRSGMLRFSLPTIIAPKIELNWGDVFEFGSNQGSDNCNYVILGGQINSTSYYQSTTGSVIVTKGLGTTSDPRIIVDGFRAYVDRQNYISVYNKWDTTIDLSTLNIPKSASNWGNLFNTNTGGWPVKFYWDGTKDLNMAMEKTSTQYRVISALTLGSFANDTAAATGGVNVGSLYRKSDGTTAWRVS